MPLCCPEYALPGDAFFFFRWGHAMESRLSDAATSASSSVSYCQGVYVFTGVAPGCGQCNRFKPHLRFAPWHWTFGAVVVYLSTSCITLPVGRNAIPYARVVTLMGCYMWLSPRARIAWYANRDLSQEGWGRRGYRMRRNPRFSAFSVLVYRFWRWNLRIC